MKTLFILFFLPIILYSFEVEKVSEFSYSEIYHIWNRAACIDNDNLIITNNRSFQIFDLSDDTFNLLVDFNLKGLVKNVSLVDDRLYVSCSESNDCLYRINLQSITNPIIEDSLNYVGSLFHFYNDGYLFVPDFSGSNIVTHIYDEESFVEVQLLDFFLFPAGEGYALSYDSGLFTIYDISDIYNINNIASDEVNGIFDQTFNPQIVNDSILILDFNEEIYIYDISNQNNWELLSSIPEHNYGYEMNDDMIYTFCDNKISQYNISDLENPVFQKAHFSQYVENQFFSNILIIDNKLYYSTYQGAIYEYEIEPTSFSYVTSFERCGWIYDGFCMGNMMYIGSILGSLEQFDISDLFEPTFQTDYFNSDQCLGINGYTNKVISLRFEFPGLSWVSDVYEIESNGFLTYITTLENPNNMGYKLVYDENSDKYFFIENNILHRFHLNESNDFIEDCTIQLPGNSCTGHIVTIDDFAYARLDEHLVILDNIDNENISIVNSIPMQFMMGIPEIKFYANYMFISMSLPGEQCKIFDISDYANPVEVCIVEQSGVIAIDEINQLLFMGSYDVDVFDISNIGYGLVEQIGLVQNWSHCLRILPFVKNNENYFVYLEDTSCSIFHYEYEPNGINNDLISISPQLTNYPNPFNPETKIVFNIPESGKVKVEIFNVKGQKVKTLDTFPNGDLGTSEIVWDGTDDNNQRVSTGVYLYQLEVDGKPVASKKMMLLK